MKLIEYHKCSTCKKARDYLNHHHINYELRDIKTSPPTKEELKFYLTMSKKDIDKFFNTSGLKYKELNLKMKKATLTLDEKLDLLSTDGMLIKRPLLVGDDFILIGFKEKEYEETLTKKGEEYNE